MEQKRSTRAKLIEFEPKKVEVNAKYNNIYYNGENNLYPNEYEAVMYASPTALKAHSIKTKFIAGRGLKINGVETKYKEQKSLNNKGHNVFDLVENASQSISSQRGVFIWVGYGLKDGEIIKKSYEVLDFSMCRISKEDSFENAGKVYYGDFTKREAVKQWFYPFNDDPGAVASQIKKDFDIRKKDAKNKDIEFNLISAIENYRGQVFYLNLDKNLVYPTHALHAVYRYADLEYQLSKYFNTNVKNGLLGKVAVLTQGLSDEVVKDVERDIREWLGPEGSDGVYHLDVTQADNLDNVLKVIQVSSNYNEKQFELTNKLAKNAIMGAFNVLPVLIDTADGALFGTSGEAYEAAKTIQDDLTKSDRNAIENAFYKIGLDIEIIPLTAIDEIVEEQEQQVIEEAVEEIVEENTIPENAQLKKTLYNRLKAILWK